MLISYLDFLLQLVTSQLPACLFRVRSTSILEKDKRVLSFCLHAQITILFLAVARLFGSSTPSANIPTADVEPIIRPDLLPSVMVSPSKLEVLHMPFIFFFRISSTDPNVIRTII